MTDRPIESGLTRRSVLATVGAAVLAGCGVTRAGSAPRPARRRRPAPPTTTTTTTTTTSSPRGPATYVANGSRSANAVALTFHGSGDVGLTQELLASAHQLSTPITVFGVGTWMQANPAVAHQIVAGGHTLGNHTYTHPDLGSLSATAVAAEIQRCATVLDGVEGNNGRWFRPSGIAVPTQLILDQAGLAGYPVSVGYDIDPLDYEDPGPAAIVARVTQALRPGSIVSLHTGHAGTVEAFPALVQMIRARNLKLVLVGDLVGAQKLRLPDDGCHVAAIVASPSISSGTQSGLLFNHFSLLLTTERLLGLPALGQANFANSTVTAFNL